MTWEYRVIQYDEPDADGCYFGVHEVYTHKKGISGWTEEPVAAVGETMDSLSNDLAVMQQALGKPVLMQRVLEAAIVAGGE